MPSLSISAIMRKIVCHNQGKYIQFALTAAELHKRLNKAPSTKKEYFRDELTKYFENGIFEAAHTNFEFLHKYFADSVSSLGKAYDRQPYNVPPRVCLKLVRKEGSEDSVYTRIRYDKSVDKDEDEGPTESDEEKYRSTYPVTSHSIFHNISEYGAAIIENDIPASVARPSGYRNTRITPTCASAYNEKIKNGTLLEKYPDREWMKCWKAERVDKPGKWLSTFDPRWCYKSTLVIPITLVGHIKRNEENKERALDDSFLEYLKVKFKRSEKDIERFIFGYVCVDHVTRNYFLDEQYSGDMNIGYIVADIISLYIVTKMALTDASEAFNSTNSEQE